MPRLGLGFRLGRRPSFSLNETGGANQLSFDSEFDNAYWSKNAGATPTANDTTAPDGTLTADRITAASPTTVAVGIYKAIAVDAGESMSVFVKAGTCTILALVDAIAGGAYAQFDLTTPAVLTSANCTATIEDFGGGWLRVSAKAISVAGGFFIIQMLDAMVAGNPWSTGVCTQNKYLHLWHARLNAP